MGGIFNPSEVRLFLNEITDFYHLDELEQLCSRTEVSRSRCEADQKSITSMFESLLDGLQRLGDHRCKSLLKILFLVQAAAIPSPFEAERRLREIRSNIDIFLKLGGYPMLTKCLGYVKARQGWNLQNIEEMRYILCILHAVTEFLRFFKDTLPSERITSVEENHIILTKLLCDILVTATTEAPVCGVPILKVVMLIWKIILLSVGSLDDAFTRKNEFRERSGLGRVPEDPAKTLTRIPAFLKFSNENAITEANINRLPFPAPTAVTRKLHWTTKVSSDDLSQFVDQARRKNVSLVGAKYSTMTAGLPSPVLASYMKLKEYVYIPLSEYQLEKLEEEIKYPLTCKKYDLCHQPTEALFKSMYESMNIVANILLELLGACLHTGLSGCKADSLMMACIDSSVVNDPTVPQENVSSISSCVGRYKMLMVRATSSILLLLMKHFKVNHICQFETLRGFIASSKGIDLLLGFFEEDPVSRNQSFFLPCFELEPVNQGGTNDANSECYKFVPVQPKESNIEWSTIESATTIARILNKLCKNHYSTSMALNEVHVADNLKQWIQVPDTALQYYCLKLIKIQSRYLGRAWRKANMPLLSAIYQMVRHRYNDDWASGSACEQAVDADMSSNLSNKIKAAVDKEIRINSLTQQFRSMRYERKVKPSSERPEEEPYDWMTDHLDAWLESEVFNRNIDWNSVLEMDNFLILS